MSNMYEFLKLIRSMDDAALLTLAQLVGNDEVAVAPDAAPSTGPDLCEDCGRQILEVGDVVWLASGGPALTIIEIDEEKATAEVYWHDGQRFQETDFPLVALVDRDPDDDE